MPQQDFLWSCPSTPVLYSCGMQDTGLQSTSYSIKIYRPFEPPVTCFQNALFSLPPLTTCYLSLKCQMNHSFSRKSFQSPCWALAPLLWPSLFPMQTSTSESLFNYRFTYLSVSSTRFISDLKTGSGCFISPSPAPAKCLPTGDARNILAGWMKSPLIFLHGSAAFQGKGRTLLQHTWLCDEFLWKPAFLLFIEKYG